MKRNSLLPSLFKGITTLSLLFILMLIYWSFTLIEEDLIALKREVTEIKSSLSFLKNERRASFFPSVPQNQTTTSSSHLGSHEKNLLTKDPFYQTEITQLIGEKFVPHGTRKEATVARPDNLNPFNNFANIREWIDMCSISVSQLDVGKFETYAPSGAHAMEIRKNDSGEDEYWVFLRQDVFWEPLNPHHFPSDLILSPHFLEQRQVTAHDYKFFFDAVMNPHIEGDGAVAMRGFYQDIEAFRIIDDFTFSVRWKAKIVENEAGEKVSKTRYLAKSFTGALQPLPCFVYQYFSNGKKIIEDEGNKEAYRTSPIWAQNFSRHFAGSVIVSCGPWIFDGMTERAIHFKRNPQYYNPFAVLVDNLEISFRDTPDSIWNAFKSGEIDDFVTPPNFLGELKQFLQRASDMAHNNETQKVSTIDYLTRAYTYLGWNEMRPYFQSKKVRQALTLAIDRERIIRQNMNGMGLQLTSPFFPTSPSYNPKLKPYPFDPKKARKLLQEEGWTDTDGDGVVEKIVDGKKISFRFSLTYYVKNPTTKAICEYVATALKDIGVDCVLNGVDSADLAAVFENRDFDAVFLGWALGNPPEDPRQLWHSDGANQKGSSNAIHFANKEVDTLIEKLEYEDDPAKRIELYHQLCTILYDEAPYTLLYVPKTTLAYRNYLHGVFIPSERQDIIPGANIGEPLPSLFWIQ